MNRTRRVLAGLAIFIVVALVVVGAYGLYWWVRHDSTNRNAKVQQDTYGRQNALVEQVLDDIRDAETAGIPASQRIAIVDQICDSAAKLTGSIQLPPHAQTFINQECPS